MSYGALKLRLAFKPLLRHRGMEILQHDTGARYFSFHINGSTNNANSKRNIAERAGQPQSWRVAADGITQLSL